MTPRPDAPRKRRRTSPRAANAAVPLPQQLSRWYALRMNHHRFLALGATLAVVGLGLVGSHETDVGALVTLAGLGTLVLSIHRYGRLGEER